MAIPDSRRKCRLLALSPIADDPRVRRMGDALSDDGWDVTGIGLPGAVSAPPSWPILTHPPIAEPQGRAGLAERASAVVAAAVLAPAEGLFRIAGSPYAAALGDFRRVAVNAERPLATLGRVIARRSAAMSQARDLLTTAEKLRAKYWLLSPYLEGMQEIVQGLEGPALWVANDWWMLPIADAGRQRSGGVIAYDSHELATEEYAERPEWRRFQRPIVAAVESALIGNARVVTTVSPSITQHLRSLYDLDVPAMTLRNAPSYEEMAFRPAGQTIRVLYHGLVRPGRGLDLAIESLPFWRKEFTLTIRGPVEGDYDKHLKERAKALNVKHRVTFMPPEAMTDLVRTASAFDIGLMALPDISLHARYALPNKLFEYLMAGLAIVVTDLPEMGSLVRSTGAGVAAARAEPAAIAEAMNSITAETLNAMKRAALEAAKRLNWQTEAAPVLAAYTEALDRNLDQAGD